jgi:hypothetical protein
MESFNFSITDAFVFHTLQTIGYVEKKSGALRLQTDKY